MITVKLFGRLMDRAERTDDSGYVGFAEVPGDEVGTIREIMDRLGLKEGETSHLFLNHDYSGPDRPVKDGDLVAIFPRDMALLYKWYFTPRED
ncbi:MAG: MoaD/ThiS family protein [Methanomassiliicoccales archaeon]